MYNYFIGAILFILLIVLLYGFGVALLGNKDSKPYNFIVGYIGYSFIMACGGIPVQLLNLPWLVFLVYAVLSWVGIIAYIVWKVKEKHIQLFEKKESITFIREHRVLFFCSLLLVILALAYVPILWENNRTDDGFYLSRMAGYPYMEQPFASYPATGLLQIPRIDAYSINIGELESSVYIYLTGMSPTVYARFFLAGFHYFVLASTIYALAYKIFEVLNIRNWKRIIQYTVAIILVIGLCSNFLRDHHILVLQEDWQFNTAMHFYSSIVRTAGILLLLLPALEQKELRIKDVTVAIVVAVVLMSKSTIALPVIGITCLSYLLVSLLFSEDKKRRIAGLLVLIGFVCISLFIGGDAEVEKEVIEGYYRNWSSFLLIGCLLVFVLSFFLKNKVIYKLNSIYILMFLFMTINPINNMFEKLSVYNYVGARAQTLLIYTFIITNFIYLHVFMYQFIKSRKWHTAIGVGLTAVFTVTSVYAVDETYAIKTNYKVILENKELIPESTLLLGDVLERLYDEKDTDINVVMSEAVEVNGHIHYVPQVLRVVAPHVKSISAITRFGVTEGNDFTDFTSDDQHIYDGIIIDMNPETLQAFDEMTHKFPVNCAVFPSEVNQESMNSIGFTLYDDVLSTSSGNRYYIYYRDLAVD